MADQPRETSGWPAPSDLNAFLNDLGVVLPAGISGRLQVAIDSAIDDFERATDYFPFISNGPGGPENGDETRYYDGPASNILDLGAGVISFTSLKILGVQYISDQPVDTGTQAQFWLKPFNALVRRRAYTYIDFGIMYPTFINQFMGYYTGYIGYLSDAPKSIAVTATYGFCTPTTVPSKAWTAVLERAAWYLGLEISSNISQGLSQFQDQDTNVKFTDSRGNAGPLAFQMGEWEKRFPAACLTYRRMVM